MRIVDVGSGPPVVVIPGIQGRWEWMRPAIDALAERCRVITFSLADEPSSGGRFDERHGIDNYVTQVRDALDARGLASAAVCGISYGGLIAAAYAARYPSRVPALILVSAISPSWTAAPRMARYVRWPRLLAPLFWLGSIGRIRPELAAALPRRADRLRMALTSLGRIARYPPGARRMGRRARLVARAEPLNLTSVHAPTLIVTGEAALDRVVPTHVTREYASLLPQARVVTLPRSGHFGMVTRPRAFADLVAPFVARHDTSTIPIGVKRAG